ncbi:MAG: sugar-binding domain-containing protein [Micropruina sp.]
MTKVPRSEPAGRRSRTSDARDHIGLLLDVSRRYYLEGQTQAEISKDAMFSRATVSRLLSEAKDRGIVQIRIGHPLERVVDAERALVRSFGLKQARVADPADPSSSQQEVARCAADLLVENSPENAVITVSNGMAVTATVERHAAVGLAAIQSGADDR